MSAALPTGTITFLFTDLEGSTRLWDQFPEEMRHALARHDALVEQAVAAAAGVVVRPRGEGDSRFAVFPSPVNAVTAAAEIQRALYAEPWQTPAPLRVRIALHTGGAELREGDYYGTEVNRCARLRSAAYGGQTLISQVTYAYVEHALPAGVNVRDLGEFRLKDLRQTERIYQLVIPGLPSDFPPLRSIEGLHTNLPASTTSFIGREREMAEVRALLTPGPATAEPGPEGRLLTISGPGGAGKTRLALEVGRELLDAYRDGVWFVELAPLSDPALLVQTTANTFGVREERGRSIRETLLDYLHDRVLLLILDNCEHMVQPVAELADELLHRAPRLHLLATTREPLRVNGERVWPIPPLSLPQPDEHLTAERLSQYEAVRLFVERAAAVRPDFRLTAQNAPGVVQVCARLDGIPLAIELAAARIRMLSIQDIATRLDDRFRLLVGGSRAALPRQRTLRALIDWSHDLLAEPERALFRRLAVFVNGWSLDAAEFVGHDESRTGESGPGPDAAPVVRRGDVLDLLSALVDKSLVIVEETPEGENRYRMLETIRQYALEHLRERGEADLYAQRHAEYYERLAKRSYAQLWGPRQTFWLPRLEQEHENLRTALEWAAREPARAERLLYMTATLWKFWEIHGHLSEGRGWLEKALARTDDAAGLTSRQKWYRANALRGAGNLLRLQGDYDQSLALHAASFTLFREVNDRFGVARELDVLGELARHQGDYARAIQLHNQSLAIRQEIRDKEGISQSLANLGIVAREQGDNARARGLLEEGLRLAREVGDRRGAALVLNNLGMIAQVECDYARATALYEESVTVYRELNDPLGISFSLQNLGNVALERGDVLRAADLYNQCLTLKRELGDKRGIGRAIAGLAEAAFFQGDYDRAQELGEQGLAIFQELTVKGDILGALGLLGFTAHNRGELARATELAQSVAALSSELGTRRGLAVSEEVLGLVAFSRGDREQATAQLQHALAIFRGLGDRRNVALTLVNLARVVLRTDPAAAQEFLEESLHFSREVGNEWGTAFALEISALVARKQQDYARAGQLFRESLRLSVHHGNRQGMVNGLGGLAGLAAVMDQLARAARLYGAADQQRSNIGSALSDPDREEYKEYYSLLQSRLDPRAFETQWAAGCHLTLEQAVEEALQES